MKYLKYYMIFESKIHDDIQDILIDLSDLDYKIYISDFEVESKKGLTISISGNGTLPIDIGEYLLRLNSYLRRDMGWVGFNYNNLNDHQVNVYATLIGVSNVFKKEINEFDKYLKKGNFLRAPFNSVKVSYFYPY